MKLISLCIYLFLQREPKQNRTKKKKKKKQQQKQQQQQPKEIRLC